MLTDLVVENLGVFETAALSLEPGCSALTGETGAGKTLIVTAVSLLAGGRADRASIRPGAERAHVEGRFLPPPTHPGAQVLVRNGIVEDGIGPEEPVEVVIARSISPSASKTRINRRLVTVGVLAEVGRALVEVVGSRMLAGLPQSHRAHEHARELPELAAEAS